MIKITLWLAALAAAAPSAATIYTLSASGSISTNDLLRVDEFDHAGLFRHAGTSLAGLPFQLDYRVDTSKLRLVSSASTSKYFLSNSQTLPSVGDAITASVRIGGTRISHIGQPIDTFSYLTGISSDYRLGTVAPYGSYQNIQVSTRSYANYPYHQYVVNARGHLGLQLGANLYVGNNNGQNVRLLTENLDITPFELTFPTVDHNVAQGYLSSYSSYTGRFDAFYFDVSAVSLTAAPAGVPEPTSWALLIAGFGLTGAAQRLALQRRGPITVAA